METPKPLIEFYQHLDKSQFLSQLFTTHHQLLLQLFNSQHLDLYHYQRLHNRLCLQFTSISQNRPITDNHQMLLFTVINQAKPLLLNDISNNSEFQQLVPNFKKSDSHLPIDGLHSQNLLIIPLITSQGVVGVLQWFHQGKPDHFTPNHTQLAMKLADRLATQFYYELAGTQHPLAYLEHIGVCSQSQLTTLQTLGDLTIQIQHLADQQVPDHLLGMALQVYFQIPYLHYNPHHHQPHPANAQLNHNYLYKNTLVLVYDQHQQTIILTTQPTNHHLLQEIITATGISNYQLQVGLPAAIHDCLARQQDPSHQVADLTSILNEIQGDIPTKDAIPAEPYIDQAAPTVVKLVDRILQEAIQHSASDIHIEPNPNQQPSLVRMRVDGVCQKVIEIPASHQRATIARIKIISNLDIAEQRLPQDGKFTTSLDHRTIEVRVATLPTVCGEGVVMRIITTGNLMPYQALGLTQHNHQLLTDLMAQPHGIIIVTGPTGSGKTTTLHAILAKLNTSDKKIWTAEDPVEITQAGLQQLQVNPKIGLDFASALRAFLRADPDIILIGEMRDQETAHTAIEAALTGHLVLSTLHTNSAPETITRLLDIGLDPVNFADAVVGIIAQRLLRALCPSCKQGYTPDQHQIAALHRYYGENHHHPLNPNWQHDVLYRAVGCPQCNYKGYKGRIAIHELLPIKSQNKYNIYQRNSTETIEQQGIKDGMHTLLQDAVLKVLQGKIDFKQLQTIAKCKG